MWVFGVNFFFYLFIEMFGMEFNVITNEGGNKVVAKTIKSEPTKGGKKWFGQSAWSGQDRGWAIPVIVSFLHSEIDFNMIVSFCCFNKIFRFQLNIQKIIFGSLKHKKISWLKKTGGGRELWWWTYTINQQFHIRSSIGFNEFRSIIGFPGFLVRTYEKKLESGKEGESRDVPR